MEKLAWNDIPALQARVTDDFGPWGSPVTVTQAMIDQFAGLSGDRQWIHVDPERAARESPFGCTIAHGFLTLVLLPRLQPVPDWVLDGHRSVINQGMDRLRFLAPVPVGSELHLCRRLVTVEPREAATVMVWEYQVALVGSEKPAMICQVRLQYRA